MLDEITQRCEAFRAQRDLLIALGAMTALLALLLVAAVRMPRSNPVRRVLGALSLRVAAMIGAGLVAIPLEPIPGLDVAYDVAAPLGLLVFWITFFRKAARILKAARRSPEARARPREDRLP